MATGSNGLGSGPGTLPSDQQAKGIADAKNAIGTGPPWWTALSGPQQQQFLQQFEAVYGRKLTADDVNKNADNDPILSSQAAIQGLLAGLPYGAPQPNIPSHGKGYLTPEDRAGLTPSERSGSATPPSNQQASAVMSVNVRSAPYMGQLISTAQTYGVPWQVLWAVIQGESGFDPQAVGDNGQSHGFAQIYSPAHPDISLQQANDPTFAMNWTAKELAQGYAKYQDWSLAVLHHNSPAAADALWRTGRNMPGRAMIDAQYLQRTLGQLPKEAGFDPSTQTKMPIAAGGKESGGTLFSTPDPESLRMSATDWFKKMFFRAPTDSEVSGLTDMMLGAYTQAAVNKATAQTGPNPFGGPAPDANTSAMVNPVPGSRVSGGYGDPRPGGRQHAGIDLAVPSGSTVVSPVSGVAHYDTSSDPNGYGYFLTIKGDDGRTYILGHLQSAMPSVNDSRVSAGQPVAISGGDKGAPGAGDSQGAHVHFEVREPGGPGRNGAIDPSPMLNAATTLSPDAVPAGGGQDPSVGGGLVPDVNIDWQSRMVNTLRNSAEYKALYKGKPNYLDEGQYADQFAQAGKDLLGTAPSDAAMRVGLAGGRPETVAGYVAGTPEAAGNATFRQSLFKKAAALNQMV